MKNKFLSGILPIFTASAALCLLLSGCEAQPSGKESAAAFTASFTAAVQAGDEKALAAYKGKTCRLSDSIDGIVSDEYLSIRCTDRAGIRIYVPAEEMETLRAGSVVTAEGRVKEVRVKKYGDMVNAWMIMDPAEVLESSFEVTGQVEEIFHDWARDGQECAAIWNSSVGLDQQINIYLPENHGIQAGDTLRARGSLLEPANPEEFCVAYIRGREPGKVFVMPDPELVRKEAGE